MVLNDQQIKDSKIISPFNDELLQSHSYDCTLGNKILVQTTIKNNWQEFNFNEAHQTFILYPGEFILASTNQYLTLPKDIIGFVQGKSSRGRDGIQIECAGLVDPLFEGEITLEIFNLSRWTFNLTPAMTIAQLWFSNTNAAELKPYNKFGRYNKQTGPQKSRLY